MDEINDRLNKLYFDNEYPSANQLHELSKKLYGYTYSIKDIKTWLAQQEGQQIFGKKKQNYFSIVGRTPDDYQMDTMFLDQYKKSNKGFIGLMTFINITSRKGYGIPIKNKTQSEMNRAFDEFYKLVNEKVSNITTDNEASFVNSISRYPEIKHWLTDVNDKKKTGKIERFNRTIRDKIAKHMKLQKTSNWIDNITKIMSSYNNSVHSAIKKPPNKVNTNDIDKIQTNETLKGEKAMIEHDLINVGDKVRVLKPKIGFEKGSDIFSRGIYTVDEKNQLSFKLINPKGSKLLKSYKAWELQKVGDVQETPIPETHQPTSFKAIRKTNKQVNRQKREFNKSVGFDIDKITDEGEVVLPKKLQPKKSKRTAKTVDEEPKEVHYEVESIVAQDKDEKGRNIYQIKWKGWGSEHNTWQPFKDVKNLEAYGEWLKRNK